jgi:hypothetical protein
VDDCQTYAAECRTFFLKGAFAESGVGMALQPADSGVKSATIQTCRVDYVCRFETSGVQCAAPLMANPAGRASKRY